MGIKEEHNANRPQQGSSMDHHTKRSTQQYYGDRGSFTCTASEAKRLSGGADWQSHAAIAESDGIADEQARSARLAQMGLWSTKAKHLQTETERELKSPT